MFILRKFCCRTFQIVMRIALPILPYRNPKILEEIEDVVDVIRDKGLRKPLIVTDETLYGLGLTKNLEEILKRRGIDFALYNHVKENPTTTMVENAVRFYNDLDCDCLIAFGGGSPIDCAKATGARIACPNMTLDKMAGILKVNRKTPLMIAIPTTAGTGSETTLAAVIVDDNTRHKYVINSFPLIPDYAVLDPSTIHSLPSSVAAATGMDALTHAVEAFIGRSTTPQTRKYSLIAVKRIFLNIEDAAAHKSSRAEKNMLHASHLAGRAFTRSYVGYVHAVSHSLSGKYNMPHGLTNAILLPIVLEMYGPAVYKKLAFLALAAGLGEKDEPQDVLAKRFIQAVYEMNAKLGIPSRISGIEKEDIRQLASYADKEANPLYPVPILWNRRQLEKIYRKAAE